MVTKVLSQWIRIWAPDPENCQDTMVGSMSNTFTFSSPCSPGILSELWDALSKNFSLMEQFLVKRVKGNKCGIEYTSSKCHHLYYAHFIAKSMWTPGCTHVSFFHKLLPQSWSPVESPRTSGCKPLKKIRGKDEENIWKRIFIYVYYKYELQIGPALCCAL